MKKLLILAALAALCMPAVRAKQTPAAPLRVIFDTDMGNDVDDPLALDMLYKAVDRGEIILLGILSSKDTEFSPRYIDMMNTWYGYPEIPGGRVRDGVVLKRDDYARAVCESGLFPRSRRDRDYGDPVTLYRRLLAESPDSSVVVVSVGFSTNLGRLLESRGDRYSPLDGIELVKQTKEACIEVNKPLSIAGWKIYQLSYDETKGKWSRMSVFELVRDPWLPIVYTGILMMIAGAIGLFLSAPVKKE